MSGYYVVGHCRWHASCVCPQEEREERGHPAKSECVDLGKELLRHLLKEKAPPEKTASAGGHRGLSGESARSEDEDGDGFPDRVMTAPPGVSDASSRKKPQRCKRAVRPDKDKNLSKCKRRRREDEEENDDALHCSSSASEQLMTQVGRPHATSLSFRECSEVDCIDKGSRRMISNVIAPRAPCKGFLLDVVE